MWNKLLAMVIITGFISLFEIFPRDSLSVIPKGAPAGSWSILPGDLSQNQRDSIIEVVPKDTSSFSMSRYFNGSLIEEYASDNVLNYERNINKSFFQRLKEKTSALLRKLFGAPDASRINDLSDKILRTLLVLIFLAALYIAVRLFMNHRGRWLFEKNNEAVIVNLSNVEKHLHKADFKTLLAEAEQNGAIRQSVRILYLWVLKTFMDNNVVQWNPDKTNVDYLAEIGDKAVREEFRYLSYLYNYIWYGEFLINDLEYRNVREAFFRHIK